MILSDDNAVMEEETLACILQAGLDPAVGKIVLDLYAVMGLTFLRMLDRQNAFGETFVVFARKEAISE